MRVAVVGESPAKGFENCTPIWGVRESDGARCQTGKRWGQWALAVGIVPQDCDYFNVSSGVPDLSDYDLVVALGAVARRHLTECAMPHFPLPHPSGRNRETNDKQRLYMILSTLQEEVRRIREQHRD